MCLSYFCVHVFSAPRWKKLWVDSRHVWVISILNLGHESTKLNSVILCQIEFPVGHLLLETEVKLLSKSHKIVFSVEKFVTRSFIKVKKRQDQINFEIMVVRAMQWQAVATSLYKPSILSFKTNKTCSNSNVHKTKAKLAHLVSSCWSSCGAT